MADANIESRVDHIAEQQARSAARIAEIEDIIAQFKSATRGRVKAHHQVNPKIRKKQNLEKTEDNLASLIADMERQISERRSRDSKEKH